VLILWYIIIVKEISIMGGDGAGPFKETFVSDLHNPHQRLQQPQEGQKNIAPFKEMKVEES
jgi:hypothetical protein